jgi:hypothetical protein
MAAEAAAEGAEGRTSSRATTLLSSLVRYIWQYDVTALPCVFASKKNDGQVVKRVVNVRRWKKKERRRGHMISHPVLPAE